MNAPGSIRRTVGRPLPPDEEKLRGLTFPWTRRAAPPPREAVELAPGVYWVRFGLPLALNHINVYLLEDEGGFLVVDTGLDLPDTRSDWEAVFAGVMGGAPVTRVLGTHVHLDHVGLAGWLVERFGCELFMSREEYLSARLFQLTAGNPVSATTLAFYRAAGYDDAALEGYRTVLGMFRRMGSPMPDAYRRLVHGDVLSIGGRAWHVVVTSGHSPEHVSLHCPSLGLLIAGDQVLPSITPNVSVGPTEPNGNPLGEWLRSCARLRDELPDDLLVLPSHGAPFRGLHARLGEFLDDHARRLDRLHAHLAAPRRVLDCFPALFDRAIDAGSYGLASGETLAHLNALVAEGTVERRRDEHGVDWYRAHAPRDARAGSNA